MFLIESILSFEEPPFDDVTIEILERFEILLDVNALESTLPIPLASDPLVIKYSTTTKFPSSRPFPKMPSPK